MVGMTVIIVPVSVDSSTPAPWWLWVLVGLVVAAILWMVGVTVKDMIDNHRRGSGS